MKTTNYLPPTPTDILAILAFVFAAYLMFNN